jgi:hypothetical protein
VAGLSPCDWVWFFLKLTGIFIVLDEDIFSPQLFLTLSDHPATSVFVHQCATYIQAMGITMSNVDVVKIVNLTPLALQVATKNGDTASDAQKLESFAPLDYPRPADGEIVVNHFGRLLGTIPKNTNTPLVTIDEIFLRSGPKRAWSGKLIVKNQTDQVIAPFLNGTDRPNAAPATIEPGKEWEFVVGPALAETGMVVVDHVVFRTASSGETVGIASLFDPEEKVTLGNEFRRALDNYHRGQVQEVVKIVNLTPLALQVLIQDGEEFSNPQDLVPCTPADYPRPTNGEIAVKLFGRVLGTFPKDGKEPVLTIDEAFVRAGLATPLPNPIFKGKFLPRKYWWGRLTVKNQTDDVLMPCFNGDRAVGSKIEPGKEGVVQVMQGLEDAEFNRVDYVVFRSESSGEMLGMACPSNPDETVTVTNAFRSAAKAYYPPQKEGNFDLVEASVSQPGPEDLTYIRHGEEKVSHRVLNGLDRDVFRVTIYGVRLLFDQHDKSGFLRTYNGRDNIEDLYIFADAVQIETGLRFPQTNVYIFCRELSFKGPDSFIDTTPISTEYRSPLQINGENGAPAGNITLNIQAFSTDAAEAKHFRAIGGKGQNPDEGGLTQWPVPRHIKPISKEEWDGFFTHKRRKLLRRAVFKLADPADVDPMINDVMETPEWREGVTHVELYNTYEYGIGEHERYLVGTCGTKDLPGKGSAGLTPGKPGTGGNGGTLTATAGSYSIFYRQANLSGGPSGTPIAYTRGGPGGTPSPAYWLNIEALDRGGKVTELNWSTHSAEPGDNSGPGPQPDKPVGDNGEIVFATGDHYFYAWLTEVNLNVAIQYARDLVATGYGDAAKKLLAPYITTLGKYKENIPGVIDALGLEASSLVEQAEQYLDAYGNPPGWVPALSLESAATIYEQVLKSSLQELYTAYYLEKLWLFKKDKQDAIRNLIGLLHSKTETTQKNLVETRKSIPKLVDELSLLVKEMSSLSTKLEDRVKILRRKADEEAVSQQQKEDLAAAFKIAGAVVKAIPLPEPYQAAAGAVGGLLDITSNFIDKGGDDDAFKALETQVKAFATESTDALVKSANQSIEAQLNQQSPEIKELERKANEAKAAKDALEGTYAEQASEFNQLVQQRQKLLDTKIKVLTEARSTPVSSANRAEKWTKEYQDWEREERKKLAAGATNYLNKERDCKSKQDAVAQAKKALEGKKEELKKQKDVNAAAVKDGIDKVKKLAASISTIGQTVNKLIVSKREIDKKFDAALAKAKVGDPEFLNLTRQIKYLDDKKEKVAKSLLQQQTELATQQNLISKNLVLMNEMRAQLSNTSDSLDPAALAYVQSVGQDAHQQLARFLYYVVKAYEYYTVQPWPESYRDAQKLFESLRKTIEPSDFKFDFDNDASGDRQQKLKKLLSSPDPRKDGGLLTSEEFGLLRLVYEKPLRDMGKALASHLMSGAGRLTETPKMIVLSANELADLNRRIQDLTAAQQIPFSLVSSRQLDQGSERQRIANMEVAFVRCKQLGTRLPTSMTFRFTHLGKSIVRASGKFFAFDPEGKPIATDLGGKPIAGRPIEFVTNGGTRVVTDQNGRKTTTNWVIEGQSPVLRDDALWQGNNAPQKNLLSILLSGTDSEQAKSLVSLSAFRPGIFSDFLFQVEISPPDCKVSFEEIQVQVTFEAGSAPTDEMLLCVDNNLGMAIPIEVDARDEGGRTGGNGRYFAVYNRRHLQGDKTVHLKVPKEFGNYQHQGWLIDGQADGKLDPIAVGKSAYLTANYNTQVPAASSAQAVTELAAASTK